MRDDGQDGTAMETTRLGEIGLNNFAPYLMNRIMGRYNASLRDELAQLGLSTPKMRTLAVLSVVDGVQIGKLAVYAVVEQSTLSRTLESLSTEGLIERRPDPDDSRATRIFITETGRRAFEALWPTMVESYEHMFAGIPDEERAAFVATLQKILINVRKHDF